MEGIICLLLMCHKRFKSIYFKLISSIIKRPNNGHLIRVIEGCLVWWKLSVMYIMICGHWLPGEHMTQWCDMGRTQTCGGEKLAWVMVYWKTLILVTHVENTLTCTSCLNTVEDHLHPSVFPDGRDLFQEDNAPWHETKIVSEGFEECWLDFHHPQLLIQSRVCENWYIIL